MIFKRLSPFFLLVFLSVSLIAQTQIGDDIHGDTIDERSGLSVDINSNGTVVAIGSHWYDNARGRMRIFEFSGGDWVQRGQHLLGSNELDFCGNVSINNSGEYVALGSGSFDNARGQVRVYQFDGASWNQLGNDILGEAEGDTSGVNIDLSDTGDIIAIGATGNDSGATGAGHVRVFEFSGGDWNQLGSDIDGESAADALGVSVSFNDDATILAIGVQGYENEGQVKVYQFDGGDWTQMGPSINGTEPDTSQSVVSLNGSGNIVAIGTPNSHGGIGDAGKVEVFEFNGTDWIQRGNTITGENVGDRIGGYDHLAIDDEGSFLAIGSPFNSNGGTEAGTVWFYKYDGSGWIQVGNEITGDFPQDSAAILSLSDWGGEIAIGSGLNDENGTDTGHVRVFDISDLLGINSIDSLSRLVIYPNPATDVLFVEGISTEYQVEMYDVYGRKVMSGSNLDRIDIQSFQSGMYLLSVSNQTETEIRRVVKN